MGRLVIDTNSLVQILPKRSRYLDEAMVIVMK